MTKAYTRKSTRIYTPHSRRRKTNRPGPRIAVLAPRSLDYWLLEPAADPLHRTYTHVMSPLVSSKTIEQSCEREHIKSSSWCDSALHVLTLPQFIEEFCHQRIIPSPCCGSGLLVSTIPTHVYQVVSKVAIRSTKSTTLHKNEVHSDTEKIRPP